MLKPIAFATAALALLAAPVQAEEPTEPTRGETELAKLLEGRVAGEPQSCINTYGSRPLNQIDGTAITYRAGDTIWVNYTRNPDSIDEDEIMVIKRFSGSNLCRTDHIDLVSRTGGFLTGVIFLDEFVPYKRTDSEG
ncbi:hypothetical protein [Qipengyuania qiaonensis]|uniref:Uncharacterized protein n=1 Tax=Qipengyuania qiaonensis TaxID=2867240 RepID=A0ABS7J8D4_9SPHN|nr:hypothetical protein [Qipengyuania qiaonensis]MBX7481918.1 hypothetical protein [Qipengyuania qiaonensis]